MPEEPLSDSIFLPPDDTLEIWSLRHELRPWSDEDPPGPGDFATQFWVPKLADRELLAAVHASLDNVLRNGGTYSSWHRSIVPVLQRSGWWGRVAESKITGSARPVTVNDARLKSLFHNTMRCSQAAGKWRKVWSERDLFPYLRYLSDHWRPNPNETHKRWHGIILRVDDDCWRTHFPPNGWGCGCHIEQLSEARLLRSGWSVSESPNVPVHREFAGNPGLAWCLATEPISGTPSNEPGSEPPDRMKGEFVTLLVIFISLFVATFWSILR